MALLGKTLLGGFQGKEKKGTVLGIKEFRKQECLET